MLDTVHERSERRLAKARKRKIDVHFVETVGCVLAKPAISLRTIHQVCEGGIPRLAVILVESETSDMWDEASDLHKGVALSQPTIGAGRPLSENAARFDSHVR